MRAKLVAANWKMNGSLAANRQWLAEFAAAGGAGGQLAPSASPSPSTVCEVVVCAPHVYLQQVVDGLAAANPGRRDDPDGRAGADGPAGPDAADEPGGRSSATRWPAAGAQDLCADPPGAHTGDICGEMLLDLGVRWVILGHSERRQSRGESDALVAAKAARALALGLRPIVCVGETLQQRDAGAAAAVVSAQIAALVAACPAPQLLRGAIAYEPIWAIGTGRSASAAQAQEVHGVIRAAITRAPGGAAAAAGLRILYGGSVKPANAAELFAQPDIDGGLIGGAALVAAEFAAICTAATRCAAHGAGST